MEPLGDHLRMRPFVACTGIAGRAPGGAWRRGIVTCRAASELPVPAGRCAQGCLALGDCAAACPREALMLDPTDRLLWIAEDCAGCGRCARACPRGVIRMLGALEIEPEACSAPEKSAACAAREDGAVGLRRRRWKAPR